MTWYDEKKGSVRKTRRDKKDIQYKKFWDCWSEQNIYFSNLAFVAVKRRNTHWIFNRYIRSTKFTYEHQWTVKKSKIHFWGSCWISMYLFSFSHYFWRFFFVSIDFPEISLKLIVLLIFCPTEIMVHLISNQIISFLSWGLH